MLEEMCETMTQSLKVSDPEWEDVHMAHLAAYRAYDLLANAHSFSGGTRLARLAASLAQEKARDLSIALILLERKLAAEEGG